MDKFISYLRESYDEMRNKVTWPTQKELQRNTILVLIASLIFAIVIGLMDLGFENLMKIIYEL